MRPTQEEQQPLPLGEASEAPAPIHQRSDAEIKRYIARDSLVCRFCLYGAIKNLQFFEAYLLLILLDWGYDLFQIGLLSAITHSLTCASSHLQRAPRPSPTAHTISPPLHLSLSCCVIKVHL